MGIHQNHFRVAIANLGSARQVIMAAEADQMLGEGPLLFVARTADLYAHRDEALLGKPTQQFMRGDDLKPLRAAGMAVVGKHGRRELGDLFKRQGFATVGLKGNATTTEAADGVLKCIHFVSSLGWWNAAPRRVRKSCISQMVTEVNRLFTSYVKNVDNRGREPEVVL